MIYSTSHTFYILWYFQSNLFLFQSDTYQNDTDVLICSTSISGRRLFVEMSDLSDDESSDGDFPIDYELRYESTDSNTTKACLANDVNSGTAPEHFIEPPHEGMAFDDEFDLQNSIQSFDISKLREPFNNVTTEVDIDMIRGSGNLNMLRYILTPHSIINVGGHVEERADFRDMTCLVTSPFQIWIPDESKVEVFQQFFNFRKGYTAIAKKSHQFSVFQYNMIGTDLLRILQNANVTKVVLYSFGMKASLRAGTEFINVLRLGDRECEISYDIAAYQPIPDDVLSAHVTPDNNAVPTPVTPLTRLNKANITEKLGSNFEVINKPHTFATQITSCVGENPAHVIPTFGTWNLERVCLDEDNDVDEGISNEEDSEEYDSESSNDTPGSTRILGSDKVLLCKAYSTLIHGIKAKSRSNPHKTTSSKSATHQVNTLLESSNSSFVLRNHFLRFELTVILPSHDEIAESISDESVNLDTYHRQVWGTMKFLMSEQETLWLSSVDVAYDMFMSCLAVTSYSKYFLPSALRYFNPFRRQHGTKMLDHERKYFSLVLANCGIHTDR